MRTIFARFREADERLTSLMSRNEFEIKHFGNDSMAEAVYTELVRYCHTLSLVYEKLLFEKKPTLLNQIMSEMTEVLGARQLSLQTFFKTLSENSLIEANLSKADAPIKLNKEQFNIWVLSLQKEIENKSYTLLSPSTLALVRQILLASDKLETGSSNIIEVDFNQLDIEHMPLFTEAKDDLVRRGLIEIKGKKVIFDPKAITHVFENQEILKNFSRGIGTASES